MLRIALLSAGCLLLFFQHFIYKVDDNAQFIIFLSGILLLGVPHGAADLLVANRNADSHKMEFSRVRFLFIYVSRLALFSATLWFFPLIGNLLFILFAAYHFGETDLHQFKTNTFLGKLFVISYGLVILSVILLHHFEDIMPIFLQFKSGNENIAFINLIDENRYTIMSMAGILFFTTTFVYFLRNNSDHLEKGYFLIRFAVILFILYNLPMLLGFTFYFVVWHSVISLKNIINYLRNNNLFSKNLIAKQIILYSVLALTGIAIFGLTGFMFISNNSMMGYVFLGLAVLTAPHMQIMHDMYHSIRTNRPVF
jgi:Brp/Blh family beta-carotene 15,15'-monooxygenase